MKTAAKRFFFKHSFVMYFIRCVFPDPHFPVHTRMNGSFLLMNCIRSTYVFSFVLTSVFQHFANMGWGKMWKDIKKGVKKATKSVEKEIKKDSKKVGKVFSKKNTKAVGKFLEGVEKKGEAVVDTVYKDAKGAVSQVYKDGRDIVKKNRDDLGGALGDLGDLIDSPMFLPVIGIIAIGGILIITKL